MAEQSKRFNAGEDAFWDHVDDVLADNEVVMSNIIPFKDRRPGEIGAVAATPLYIEWVGDDLPPDAA